MQYVFLSIFIGVSIGLLLQRRGAVRRTIIRTMQPLTFVLLLVMGINLGTDASIWSHLGDLGLTAAVLAVFNIAGSILMSSLYQFLPGQRQRR